MEHTQTIPQKLNRELLYDLVYEVYLKELK